MTKAEIVNEIAKTTGIIPVHNIPAFKLADAFKEEVAK